MSAELLAMLGGASAVPSRREAEPKTLLSFKAGKLTEELQPVRSTIDISCTFCHSLKKLLNLF